MLTAGTRMGQYEILTLIGAGGMGEVYRARDTRLKRDVALKVLPEAFAGDPERMARFQREAEVLASLNHPNIAHIYGVEERALAMELVEGEMLSGALPIDTALHYARQIAEALEYAHERGVIHRDLKPANVKVTPEGVVKLLDFGLAKAIEDPVADTTDPANSPTLTLGATRLGVIMGTAAYMSPEQASGKPADRRADIWSFGAVLYEMLAGKKAFEGESVSDTLASVLKLDPDWNALPALTPTSILKLVRRSLTKDRRKRLQAIGEARITIEDALSGAAQETQGPAQPAPAKRGFLPWAVAAACLGVALAVFFLHFRESRPTERVLRLSVALPENTTVGALALSPDGRRLAMVLVKGEIGQVWVRALDSTQLQLLSGTDRARDVFWSPDSRFIGFFAYGKLKTIPASGGPVQTLCDSGNGGGGTWSRGGVILFATDRDSLQRVNAAGGACSAVAKPEGSRGGRFPVFLPDGNHFLSTARAGDEAQRGVFLATLDRPDGQRLLADQVSVVFAPRSATGKRDHLLFLRNDTLMAQPFDATSLQIAGDAFRVARQASIALDGAAAASGGNGVLVYLAGGRIRENIQFTWLDRDGKELGKVGARSADRAVTLSPDDKTIAFDRQGGVWLRELSRDVESRFTFPPLSSRSPVWSPDSKRIALSIGADLYLKEASGGGQEEPLLKTGNPKLPTDWSRDGRFLLYTEIDPKTRSDIWYLQGPLGSAETKPVLFLKTEFDEGEGQLSPDGRWIAYVSDESGQPEVYVRPFPSGSGKWRISSSGGREPRWRRDGRELFFVEGAFGRRKLIAVPLPATSSPEFQAGAAKVLFEFRSGGAGLNRFSYSPSADGQRFLASVLSTEDQPTLNVITNWERAVAPAAKEAGDAP